LLITSSCATDHAIMIDLPLPNPSSLAMPDAAEICTGIRLGHHTSIAALE
jgi:hypothetical protein